MAVVPHLVLDRASPEPLYSQIKAWMLQEIESGRWPNHYKLPAEDDLASHLKVSRGTLRQALRELITAGRLTQIQGKGTFVSSAQIEQPLAEHLVAFSEDLISRHVPFETRVLSQSVIKPTQRIASLLSIAINSDVFFLKRVRMVEGSPVVLLNNYVVRSKCPAIETIDFTQQRLFEALENQFELKLDWGRRTFEARIAEGETAELLGLAAGAPVMYMEQVVYLPDGTPIEMSDVWLHGSTFKLSAMIKRHAAVQHMPSFSGLGY